MYESRMNEFKKLRKSVRQKAIAAGIIKLVAQETGFTRATVSRTFSGRFDTPNPKIADALNRALVDLGIEKEAAA